MRRRLLGTTTGVVGAVVVGAILAGAAGASPRNDHTRTETIECAEPLGTVSLTIVDPPNRADREGHDDDQGGARTAFTSDGRVLVLKGEESSWEGTAAVAGEAPVPFGGSESASWGAHGAGVARQLVECGGSGTFTDSFVVDDADFAQELNQFLPAPFDWADHVGDEVTVTGTFTFTVLVMVPR